MILKTKRLILRPWEESDAKDLFKFASDPRIGPIAGWPAHKSEEESLEIIRRFLSVPETYAVTLKEDQKAIGSIGLKTGKNSEMDLKDNEAEIGYWIGVPYWGNGLIPEATKEIIRHAFNDLHLECLWCEYYDGNEKSHRVQEKCGFTYHHTCNNVYVPQMKETRIGHVTQLTRTKWEESL